MPFASKKDEIRRPQFSDETNAVVTFSELTQMIKDAKINFKNLEETPLDRIYSEFRKWSNFQCHWWSHGSSCPS